MRPIRNVTATRKRSVSSSASTGGALSTSSWVNEYGWNQPPCHGSSRLAMTSDGSQTPSSRVTAASRAPVGRAGITGASSGVSPPTWSSRTHTSTPSSKAGNGFQPNSRPPVEAKAVPRADQRTAVQRPGREVGAQVRAGRGSDMQPACWSRQATISTPPTVVPNGLSVRTSVLAAKTYQLPLGRCLGAAQRRLDQSRLRVLEGGLLIGPV